MSTTVAAQTLYNPARENNRFRWDLLIWFINVHLWAAVGVWYFVAIKCSPVTVTVMVTLWLLRHISISMGPHRLWSHASFKAHPAVQFIIAVINAGTFQNSILWWCGEHIKHHKFSDKVGDPYTVLHGFWWAHWLWILYEPDTVPAEAKRLVRNKILVWQHKYHLLLGIAVGIVLPVAICTYAGDFLGGVLGVALSLAIQYNGTWVINSVAHKFGPWRYSPHLTARTCYWVMMFTVGEWNHEGHHIAEEDYRLGNRRWYDFDPTKWLIYSLSLVGLTWDLRRVSDEEFQTRLARHAHALS